VLGGGAFDEAASPIAFHSMAQKWLEMAARDDRFAHRRFQGLLDDFNENQLRKG
jgi:hypothetical protein